MIRVVAILTAKPGRREEFIALFRANIPAVLQEKGCTEYMPVVDVEGSSAKMGPDTVVIIESWKTWRRWRPIASLPIWSPSARRRRTCWQAGRFTFSRRLEVPKKTPKSGEPFVARRPRGDRGRARLRDGRARI